MFPPFFELFVSKIANIVDIIQFLEVDYLFHEICFYVRGVTCSNAILSPPSPPFLLFVVVG